MFLHYIKYCFITSLRKKEIIFWTLLFPIALSTFMYAGFGKINETTELAKPIPVAVIHNQKDEFFDKAIESISKGDKKIITVKNFSINNATKALNSGKIIGIFYVDDTISLSVKGNNLKETVLSTFLDEYLQRRDSMNFSTVYACKEQLKSHGSQDNIISNFYAILAMTCLFSVFTGLNQIYTLQGNLSALGARRSLAPVPKSIIIFSEFITALFLQFIITSIGFFYMKNILKLNFGERILEIFPVLILGNACGIALGILVGCLKFPRTEGGKTGLATGISMILSVADDLCAPSIRIMIERNYPILNRINPATLISDALYSLNVYETKTRYYTNLTYLSIIAIILCVISYILTRRNRYASL
ncbi:ABC transporter permease [Lachnobacterium bovis]|uniref:ABC transporter permease n=1 Tax=Lachnobacterium bovis TaxID=140626 RepID=UPI00048B4E0D|nr:ABC transporter permease [Lachnobacterium bovis]